MILFIRHLSHYRYAEPVRLAPHYLRLQPRSLPHQETLSASLRIDPPPRGEEPHLDAEGNHVRKVWFEGEVRDLRIESRLTVETRLDNPFRFLLEPEGLRLPLSSGFEPASPAAAPGPGPAETVPRAVPSVTIPSAWEHPVLAPYVEGGAGFRTPGPFATAIPASIAMAMGPPPFPASDARGPAALPVPPLPAWRAYAQDLARAAADETLVFLSHLARSIHRDFRPLKRPQGPPFPPETTFRLREGSCRDLAVLFIACCRSLGIPSRFVSGYCLPLLGSLPPELHAWVEVYLPGAGWRGYDPSEGLAVTTRHVALAAARRSEDAAVVTGTISPIGAGASSSSASAPTLSVELEISTA